MDPEDDTIKVAILTISDTRTSSESNMETFDSSGYNLKQLINNYNVIESAKVVDYDCVTDDFEKIQAKMVEMCFETKVDVLLSTGGTGFAPRDVTPDATLGLVQKLTPGISHAIMNESLKITPMAMLSRAVAGIYNKTLIINLPGSKNASEQCLRVISCVIPHAVSLIKDKKETSKQFHNQFNFKTNNESIVPECVSKIACRHRESPFPKISIKSALNILKEQSFLQYNDNNKLMYPTVWIFSTGDELKCNEDKFSGYITDTNSIMITQILKQDKYKGQVLNYGVVKDNWVDLCKKFEEAFNNADIVVTSGGVSMGEKDLIKHVLKEHFKCHIHFGRVDMKPGMPTTFVTLFFNNKKKYVFCLPGNPVSAGVCTHLFLLPFLRSVSGRKSIVYSFKARITHDINNLDVRPEYKRALLKYQNGEFIVSCLTDLQQSSRLLSFVGSNCLLQLPSSTKQSKVRESTIMDVLLIKSIENTYIAPVFIERNLELVYQRHKDDNQQRSVGCLKDVLDFMSEHLLLLKTKNIPTVSAIGYVLHSPVNSLENLPPFEASIKDGYAIKYIDSDNWSQKCNIFKVAQVSVAGSAPNCQEEICENECARISTGAPLPPGTNCVVQVEDTSVLSKSIDGTVEMTIAILKEPKQFDNIRSIGSDISVGQRLLDKYTEIGPFEVALLRSVGCEQVCVYKYPDVHIIPYIDSSMYQTSAIIKNMIKSDGFKGNVYTHSLQNELCKFDEKYWNLFEYDDIVIICSIKSPLNFFLDNINCCSDIFCQFYHISLGILLRFSIVYIKDKRIVMLHTPCYDLDSIYNCVHLFILPFLRMDTGKKQHISAIKTKSNYKMDLPTDKLSRAEFKYENGDFNVTCFTLNHQNCIIDHSSQVMNTINAKNELDVIVTENSDSYLINY